jgi:hypothetical protein
VSVESDLNKGTTFHLLFELIESDSAGQGGNISDSSMTKMEAG